MLCSQCNGELHPSGTFCTACGYEEKTEQQRAKVLDSHRKIEANMRKHSRSSLMNFYIFFGFIATALICWSIAFIPFSLTYALFDIFEIGLVISGFLFFLVVVPFALSPGYLWYVRDAYKVDNTSVIGGQFSTSLRYLRNTSKTDLFFRIMTTIFLVFSIIGTCFLGVLCLLGYGVSLFSSVGEELIKTVGFVFVMVLFNVLIGFGINIFKNRRHYITSMVDALQMKHNKPIYKAPVVGSILMGAFWVIIGLVLIPYFPVLDELIDVTPLAVPIVVAPFITGIYYILSGVWMKCFDKDMRPAITAYRHENKVLAEIAEETQSNIEEYERSIIFPMAEANNSVDQQAEKYSDQEDHDDVIDYSKIDNTPDIESNT